MSARPNCNPFPMRPRPRSRAFTLVELIIVIGILAVLSGLLAPKVLAHLSKSHDVRRIADIRAIQKALASYYTDHGSYPAGKKSTIFRQWDVSFDGGFIPELVNEGYLSEVPVDPGNDFLCHYRYAVFPAGTGGCKGTTPFYVLGVTKFESPGFGEEHKGFFKCSGRDWGREFAYVVGDGATFLE
ncbi:MAG TPA: prepilin-type N-terminal cleavage/methylation domain-containing protein [Planctomycetes bacterium]|nr:prepilin-type N-terminal cleavage/methylation domain-containing protein [Planctomycetota bacterium]